MHYFGFFFQLAFQVLNLQSEDTLFPGKLVYQSFLFFQPFSELTYKKVSQSQLIMVFFLTYRLSHLTY